MGAGAVPESPADCLGDGRADQVARIAVGERLVSRLRLFAVLRRQTDERGGRQFENIFALVRPLQSAQRPPQSGQRGRVIVQPDRQVQVGRAVDILQRRAHVGDLLVDILGQPLSDSFVAAWVDQAQVVALARHPLAPELVERRGQQPARIAAPEDGRLSQDDGLARGIDPVRLGDGHGGLIEIGRKVYGHRPFAGRRFFISSGQDDRQRSFRWT